MVAYFDDKVRELPQSYICHLSVYVTLDKVHVTNPIYRTPSIIRLFGKHRRSTFGSVADLFTSLLQRKLFLIKLILEVVWSTNLPLAGMSH